MQAIHCYNTDNENVSNTESHTQQAICEFRQPLNMCACPVKTLR